MRSGKGVACRSKLVYRRRTENAVESELWDASADEARAERLHRRLGIRSRLFGCEGVDKVASHLSELGCEAPRRGRCGSTCCRHLMGGKAGLAVAIDSARAVRRCTPRRKQVLSRGRNAERSARERVDNSANQDTTSETAEGGAEGLYAGVGNGCELLPYNSIKHEAQEGTTVDRAVSGGERCYLQWWQVMENDPSTAVGEW